MLRPTRPGRKRRRLKAISLDETDALAHRALAAIATWTDWNWAAAEREWKRTIELDPGNPEPLASGSHFLMHMGRRREALAQIRRALELDPFDAKALSFYSMVLLGLRRPDEAIAQARNALRTVPGQLVAMGAIVGGLQQKGRKDQAAREWRKMLELKGDHDSLEAFDRGYREAGHRGAWKRYAEHCVARFPHTYTRPTEIANAYLNAGEISLTLDWLEKGFELRDPNMPYLAGPNYDPLRSEPRYQALLRKLNLPE